MIIGAKLFLVINWIIRSAHTSLTHINPWLAEIPGFKVVRGGSQEMKFEVEQLENATYSLLLD